MTCKFTMVAFVVSAFITSAAADETAMTKFRNLTPQQVRDMPEKVRRSELPMSYIFAAQRGLAADSELLFGMQLNQLMYPGIHDYKAAVMALQKDLGDPSNGVLTVWQIYQLEFRSEYQKLARVLFPDSLSANKQDKSAVVEGTVIILDDKIAWPINHHKIACWKAEKSCEVTQVMLDVPKADSWTQSYHVMVDRTEYYTITRWAENVIDAELPSRPDSCRTVSLSLNFKTKEFFFITKNAGGTCEILGKAVPKLPKPRISQVVDGKNIIAEEFAKVARTAYGFLASDFRKKVDELGAKSGKTR